MQGLGGEIGTLAGVLGSSTISSARAAGFRKIEDLIDRALLDPTFGRALAMKAPPRSQAGDAAMRFQFGRIGRATAFGLTAGQEPPTKVGGRSDEVGFSSPDLGSAPERARRRRWQREEP